MPGWIVYRSPEQAHETSQGRRLTDLGAIIESIRKLLSTSQGGVRQMKHQLGMMLGISALMIGPAMGQNQPNPAQAAAKTLLQAADKAIGPSRVLPWTEAGTGRLAYPRQRFG